MNRLNSNLSAQLMQMSLSWRASYRPPFWAKTPRCNQLEVKSSAKHARESKDQMSTHRDALGQRIP